MNLPAGATTMHISKRDAEAEAVRIAEAFLTAERPDSTRARYELFSVSPDLDETGARDRKTIIKYTVVFRHGVPDGPYMDGGEAMVRVNIKAREARWWP